ncbi:hypothetical protein B0H14DRAFT_2606138 [Mycena olivaceomarginata]|nr:hypothetical protein B0H14DRAFT_2606138 [Mycena olivaceomarginata]
MTLGTLLSSTRPVDVHSVTDTTGETDLDKEQTDTISEQIMMGTTTKGNLVDGLGRHVACFGDGPSPRHLKEKLHPFKWRGDGPSPKQATWEPSRYPSIICRVIVVLLLCWVTGWARAYLFEIYNVGNEVLGAVLEGSSEGCQDVFACGGLDARTDTLPFPPTLVLGPPPVVIQEDRRAESRFCVARSYDEGAGACLPLTSPRASDPTTMYDGINAQFADHNVVAYFCAGARRGSPWSPHSISMGREVAVHAKGRKWQWGEGGKEMVAMGGGRAAGAPLDEGMCMEGRVALAMCGLCQRDPPSLDEMSFDTLAG